MIENVLASIRATVKSLPNLQNVQKFSYACMLSCVGGSEANFLEL